MKAVPTSCKVGKLRRHHNCFSTWFQHSFELFGCIRSSALTAAYDVIVCAYFARTCFFLPVLALHHHFRHERRHTHVEDLWFSNDTLVIKAGAKIFKVSKSLLAARSTVFRDMVEFPQPADGDTKLIDGSPVVSLQHSADDVEVFLRAIFVKVRVSSLGIFCYCSSPPKLLHATPRTRRAPGASGDSPSFKQI